MRIPRRAEPTASLLFLSRAGVKAVQEFGGASEDRHATWDSLDDDWSRRGRLTESPDTISRKHKVGRHLITNLHVGSKQCTRAGKSTHLEAKPIDRNRSTPLVGRMIAVWRQSIRSHGAEGEPFEPAIRRMQPTSPTWLRFRRSSRTPTSSSNRVTWSRHSAETVHCQCRLRRDFRSQSQRSTSQSTVLTRHGTKAPRVNHHKIRG